MKKSKSEPDWKQFGQFLSMVMSLYVTVRNELEAMGIGVAEAMAWATEQGKDVFVAKVRSLGLDIVDSRPKPVVTSVKVDLGKFPKTPFELASVRSHTGMGTVTLERRADRLCMDGMPLFLYTSPQQYDGKKVAGDQLMRELLCKTTPNANVLDALCEHPELIPEDWKLTNPNGIHRTILFWGTRFADENGQPLVRCLSFGGTLWVPGWYAIHRSFDGRFASLATL